MKHKVKVPSEHEWINQADGSFACKWCPAELEADAVLHAHQEILDLFARNTPDYDPQPDEVDRINDGLTLILGNMVQELITSPKRKA